METIKFAVAGDIAPGGNLISKQIVDPLLYINPVIMDCEFLWANLECPVAFEDTPIKNNSTLLSGDLEVLLKIIGNRKMVLSMANNHAMDYGLLSLLETKEILTQNGVNVFGVGAFQNEARKLFVCQLSGIKIGMIAYSSDEKWVGDHLKGEAGTYISILNEQSFNEVIRYSREVDHLFIAVHFGREFTDYPVPNDITISRQFIDAGASAVFGHHAHVIQGYDVYKGKPIFYGLGNFIFPFFNKPSKLRWTKKESTGLLVKMSITKTDIVSWKLVPTFYSNEEMMVVKLNEQKRHNLLVDVYKKSSAIKLTPKKYIKKYNQHIKWVSFKLIFRGILRNIYKPKLKHFHLLQKLIKQILFGVPNTETKTHPIDKTPTLTIHK